METTLNANARILTAAIAVVILVTVGALYARTASRLVGNGAPTSSDRPPEIAFTWTPIERSYLEQVRGKLVMTDDRGLDFTTYSMEVVEAGITLDLPIPGLTGREYEQDIAFTQFAGNGNILRKGEMTVVFRIKDTAGQEAVLTKVIKVRNDHLLSDAEARAMLEAAGEAWGE